MEQGLNEALPFYQKITPSNKIPKIVHSFGYSKKLAID